MKHSENKRSKDLMRHTAINYRYHRNKIITAFGNKCTRCGSTDKLEFHIISGESGKAKGGWQHLEEIIEHLINNTDSIDLVCQNCHIKIHKETYNNDQQ